MLETNDDLSFNLTQKKLDSAKDAGADYMATGCTFCQFQFDTVQKEIATQRGTNSHVPTLLYSQLLGLSMGIQRSDLGLANHEIDATGVLNFLSPE